MNLATDACLAPIASLMQPLASSVTLDQTIQEVEALLAQRHVSAAPVRSTGGSLLGIITSGDLLRFHASGKDAAQVKVWEICHYRPLEVAPDVSIKEVAALMADRGIHHAVVAQDGKVEGIVSSLDFVRLVAKA
ncbi:CBS domain-containing protein [Noviherbaspirillum galbum]|uniref:CBS domain-containing protein n=1 Tax=Noviherbaspirillum galbum TaxID=2709383 RepID=A0A6B3SQI0_9BURK|nr:CBS domain-containing protein [Noviherbaspirillum galbum]NEX62901.1 CBS domain-containing protein [Noviherbaspirillum galbum]